MKIRILWLAVVFLVAATPSFSQKGFTTGVASGWIIPSSYSLEPADTSNTSGGYYYLLIERQHHADKIEMYKHYAIKVLSEKGLQFASSISESYDPNFQSLTFHTVNIVRNGKALNKLDKNKFKVIQREESLDRHIYDGSLSAILDLDDVQVGDVVEYSYSIKGQNSLFKGKFFNSFYLNFGVPSGKITYRIFASPSKNLTFKYFLTDQQVSKVSTTTFDEYSIIVTNPKVILSEDGTPGWYETSGRFEVSQFSSNKELAEWATELFDVNPKNSDSLIQKVREIKKNNSSLEKQIMKTIQFVQDEIRYLSLSDGISAYKPHPPTEVFDQRFGDCKDKSLLLTSMLRLLGVKSTPVLVNTYYGKTLNESLPSPWNFNHCIVKMEYQDSTYWIDPTISFQRGSLKKIYIPSYHHGLDVTDHGLLSIPFGFHKSSIDVQEEFQVAQVGTSATLDVITTYHGDESVSMRIYKESNSQEEIDKAYLNFYASDYPNISLSTSVDFEDDAEKNVLKTREHYKIDPFWNYDSVAQQYKIETYPRVLAGYVKNPETKIRKNPFSLVYPLDVNHTLILNLPEEWKVEEKKSKIESAGFSFNHQVEYNDRALKLVYGYKTKKEFINSNEIKEHLEKTKKIFEELTFQLSYSKQSSENAGFNWPFLVISIVAMAGAILAAIQIYKYNPPAISTASNQYSEIGGWLILFAIGLVLNPIIQTYSFLTNEYFNPVQWKILAHPTFAAYNPTLGLLVIFEMVGTIALIAYAIVCVVLFFKKRSSVPKLIIIFCIVSLIFSATNIFLATNYFKLFSADETLNNWKEVAKEAIRAFIWVPYFALSDRARGTFVNTI